MEKIIFIGGIYPEKKIEEIRKTENDALDMAADTLQKNIIKGIEANIGEHLTVFNSYFLGDSGRKIKKVEPYIWTCHDGGINYNLPYVRLKGYLPFSKIGPVKEYVSKWIAENNPNGKTKIIVYPAYFPFLIALNSIKKFFDIEVCMVVADLPQYMGLQARKTLYQKMTLKVTMSLFNKYLPVVDKFVLLTEAMNTIVNKDNKPYIVMEGIASEMYEYKNFSRENLPKVVLYSGGMKKKYGIPNLLEAAKLIKDQDVEFRFYGKGDAVDLITEYAKQDNRIKYCGTIDVNTLHDEQQKSTILVNPRQNNEEFTKYSFPSKNLEYMLSGRPIVAYMLDGIPKEYSSYFVVPKDDSVESLAECIQEVLSKTPEEQSEIGMKARSFVLQNNNPRVQAKKIIDLLNLS